MSNVYVIMKKGVEWGNAIEVYTSEDAAKTRCILLDKKLKTSKNRLDRMSYHEVNTIPFISGK